MTVLSRFPARSAAIGFAAAATLTLAACGGGAQTASSGTSPAASPTSSVTNSATNSAAASSTGASSSASGSATVDATHNDTDVTFVQMMIPHHQGAIEMADLAPTRAGSAAVKDLAAKIKAAQGPEIEEMTAWLQAWGVTTDSSSSESATSSGDMGGMDHGGMGGMGKEGEMSSSAMPSMSMSMPGEMTEEQMSQLEASSGTDFDRMFLEMMVVHHQGAVEMAQTEIDGGANPEALELAQSIKSSQTEEIAQMRQLLQTL